MTQHFGRIVPKSFKPAPQSDCCRNSVRYQAGMTNRPNAKVAKEN